MSYWRDESWQETLLKFICRDRNFLKKISGMLSEKHFKPRKGEGMHEAYIVAQKAFEYWRDYREPIGGMLQPEILDYIRQNKKKIGRKSRERLMELVNTIKRADGLVAVEAVEKKVSEYLQRQDMSRAVREIIEVQEKGELTPSKFQRIVKNAVKTYDNALKVSHFTDEDAVEKRIKRREKRAQQEFPAIMIEQFDQELRTFPRGEYGLGLAKYKTGKSTLACHLAKAYALQGYNVLMFTLEDPSEMVEDRLDASFTFIKMKKLATKSNRLRRRMKKALIKIRGRIKVVDGSDEGLTIQRMEEIWENFRNQGFTADMVLVDADEGVLPTERMKGDSGERREMKAIHIEFKKWMSRKETWGWMMAQTRRGKSGVRKTLVTADDSAEDISKARRAALVLGIGDGPEGMDEDNTRYLNVPVHRYDKAKKGWPVVGDYSRAIFYDPVKTAEAISEQKED